jgi:alkylation response protein AidB-like acyl-CoA dehydrogenase
VIELEPPLRRLRDLCREVGADLRARALSVDADPADMERHLDSPTLALVRAAATPKQFRTVDLDEAGHAYNDSCLSRVVAGVEMARGDAGVLVANTGPALAGVAVDALGSEEQQELFYQTIADGRTWTFFAMTEPEHGSDATALRSRLVPDPQGDGYLLSGAKRYVSNACRGGIGVVFARTGESPLSIRGALLTCPAPGFTAAPLEMVGLRGARISEISLDEVPVPRSRLLGSHLPASRRGLWGASRAFNIMRVQIAALALGVAFAARDYVLEQRPGWSGHELASARLDAALALVYRSAAEVDLAPDARQPPSVAKLHATDTAVRITRWAAAALGPGSLLEHPLLEKWSRDVYAFEFMDGTSNILRLHIAQNGALPGREA